MRVVGWLFLLVGLYLLAASAVGILAISAAGHGREWSEYGRAIGFGLVACAYGGWKLWKSPKRVPETTLGDLSQYRPGARVATTAPASAKPQAVRSTPTVVVVLILAGAVLLPFLPALLQWLLAFLGVPEKLRSIVFAAPSLIAIFVVPGVLVVWALRELRGSAIVWDRHLASYVLTQSVRFAVALALFVLGASGWTLLIPPRDHEAATLLLLTFGTPVMLLATVLGMSLAWLFLRLTRFTRNRSIGEIARENDAREAARGGD
jgi:hypothetical protein